MGETELFLICREKFSSAASHGGRAFNRSPKPSRSLKWKCNLLHDCFQPISHFLFPSFTLLVSPWLCGTLDLSVAR